MKTIKVFGSHSVECDLVCSNLRTAMQITGAEATIELVESPSDLVKNNIYEVPVIKVDGVTMFKGKVPAIVELRELLLN